MATGKLFCVSGLSMWWCGHILFYVIQEGTNYSRGFQSTAWESRILLEPYLSSLTSSSFPKYPSFLVLLPVWSPVLAFDPSRRQVMEQQAKPSWEMQDLQPVCPNSCWEGGSAVPLTAGAPFLWDVPCIARLQVSSHWMFFFF